MKRLILAVGLLMLPGEALAANPSPVGADHCTDANSCSPVWELIGPDGNVIMSGITLNGCEKQRTGRRDGSRCAHPVMWIRGPTWDGFWILTGLPLGLALLCLTVPWYDRPNPQHYGHSTNLLTIFTLVPLLKTGHSLSPIALAWSHQGFRRVMVERRAKFILLPGAVFLAAAGIGSATSLGLTSYVNAPHHLFLVNDLSNPFPVLVWVYMLWNAYHFGMQNFGVLPIYHKKREQTS